MRNDLDRFAGAYEFWNTQKESQDDYDILADLADMEYHARKDMEEANENKNV